jgi:predicted RNA polymerase sigma factor
VERLPRDGEVPSPGGWLTTATRNAIDRLRRESQRDVKHQTAQMLSDDTPPEREAVHRHVADEVVEDGPLVGGRLGSRNAVGPEAGAIEA